MKVRLTDRAVADIEALADYLVERGPVGAKNVQAAIERSFSIIERHPALGTPQSIPGVRKLTVRRYPYLIYYTVDEASAEIRVLTIQHAARERNFFDA